MVGAIESCEERVFNVSGVSLQGVEREETKNEDDPLP